MSEVRCLKMSYWWNDTDRAAAKSMEENLSECHFIRYKSHIDWPGMETESNQWQVWE